MANTILCPTRGGQASYPNQDRAIAIAKEREVEILFLYITNVEFLDHTPMAKVVDLESEMDEMGEFMLTMAQERAENRGVRARIAVRRGEFRDVLKDIVSEHEIQTIVLGSSAGGTGVVTPEFLHDLAEDISCTTGVEFIVVDQGKVVSTYKPE
jgi:nucleotide-binding universal stress UspA family protein